MPGYPHNSWRSLKVGEAFVLEEARMSLQEGIEWESILCPVEPCDSKSKGLCDLNTQYLEPNSVLDAWK
jgi:hypothetical protein